MLGLTGGIAGMYWRFLVATDEDVDIYMIRCVFRVHIAARSYVRYVVRDCDARLNEREKNSVDEWLRRFRNLP